MFRLLICCCLTYQEKDYGVRTKVIAIDFNGGLDIYENIASEINGFNIGILVNNVGTSYPYPELFLDVADRDTTFEQILRCNIASVVHMTKVLLPHMISNKKGIILNISSISGSIPQPMLAVYSASKVPTNQIFRSMNGVFNTLLLLQAFVDKFSEDINTEYASHGIIVQAVLPGFVVTNMTKLRSARLLHPNADQYVTSAMRSIGYARHTTGYIPHALMRLMLRTSHEYIPTATNTITLFIMKKIKKISLRLNEKFEEDQKLKEKSH